MNQFNHLLPKLEVDIAFCVNSRSDLHICVKPRYLRMILLHLSIRVNICSVFFYISISLRLFSFLGPFVKLWKATLRFIIFVLLSVRRHGATRLPLEGFSWNLIFEGGFRKYLEKIQVLLKPDKNKRTIYEDKYTFMITYGWILLRMRNIHLW